MNDITEDYTIAGEYFNNNDTIPRPGNNVYIIISRGAFLEHFGKVWHFQGKWAVL